MRATRPGNEPSGQATACGITNLTFTRKHHAHTSMEVVTQLPYDQIDQAFRRQRPTKTSYFNQRDFFCFKNRQVGPRVLGG